MKPRAAIVIPNWNGIDLLAECLDSLRAQTLAAKIILVDNGSVDGSVELVREHYPEVQLIALDYNSGFTGGCNRGIEAALEQDVEYVALLNNDAVADAQWLERLVAAAEAHPEAGAVGAKILTQDGKRLDSTGDVYSIWGFPFPRGRDEADKGQYDAPDLQEVMAVSGGASLFRTAMLRQIGLFDQRYFAYYEDQDLCFRAQLAGWKVRYEPAAVVRHYVGGSSTRMDEYNKSGSTELAAKDHTVASGQPSNFARYHTVKNFVYLYTKNMPTVLYWRYLPRFITGFAMISANSVVRGQGWPWLQAIGRLVVTLPGVWVERWRVQRGRRVSAAYIDSLLYKQMPPTQKSLLRLLNRVGLGRFAKRL
jgi:GT2 family glycosyltransferase